MAFMPRFVILEHDHPFLHWDFMLEAGGVLRTWRLEAPPEAGCVIRAEELGDHRLAYLEYEGPLSGDRGRVKRYDSGEFEWESEEAEQSVVRLVGRRCCGRAVLRRSGEGWTFVM